MQFTRTLKLLEVTTDTGDYVVVINAAKVALTGKKEEQNRYISFSGYVGGELYKKLSEMRARRPEFIIQHAVKGATAFDDTTGEVSGAWVLGRPPAAQPGLLFYIMVDTRPSAPWWTASPCDTPSSGSG